MMDPFERCKKTMYNMVRNSNYLNARKKKEIHGFQWEMLWVNFLEVECIVRVEKHFSFWTL